MGCPTAEHHSPTSSTHNPPRPRFLATTYILIKLFYVSQILYAIVNNTTKIAILILYLRIFPNPRFRLWTKLVMGWISCRAFAYFIAVTLQCIPVSTIWTLKDSGKCVSSTALVFSGAAFSITEDILIILLPIPELKTLKVTVRKRISLIFMFALGSL